MPRREPRTSETLNVGNRLHKAYRQGSELLEGLSPGARFVLWLYCELADDDTLVTWPSLLEIQRLTGMCERSVQAHLRVLVKKGRLVLVSSGGGRKYTNSYRVEMGLEARAKAAPADPKPRPSTAEDPAAKAERDRAVAKAALESLRTLGIDLPEHLLGKTSP